MSKLLEQRVESVRLDTLTPHPDNPRVGDVAAIVASIEANEPYGVIIVQASTNFILAGNHRWQALTDLGYEEALVALVDVDDEAAKAIVLADNRTHDLGSYDDAALARVLGELADYEGTGYDETDVAALMASVSTAPSMPTGAGAPDVPPVDPPIVPQGLRPLVLPFDLERYEALTAALPELRREWGVETNAELFLAVVRAAADEMEAEAAAGHIEGND